MARYLRTIILLLALSTATAWAQGTADDYKRAYGLWWKYAGKVAHYNMSVQPEWNGKFRYSVFTGDSTAWYEVSTDTGEKRTIATPKPRKNNFHRRQQEEWAIVRKEKGYNNFIPGDTARYLYHKDNNLFLRNKRDGSERQLTFDGTDTCYYSTWGAWSADGKYYACVTIKPAPERFVTLTEAAPKEQLQPRYKRNYYTKPGDSLDIRTPVIIDVEKQTVLRPQNTEWDGPQYYVSSPVWTTDGKAVTFEYNARGHKTFRVMEMNMAGKVRTLIEERNEKYVAYSRNLRRDLRNGDILWKSDRSGKAHLYIYRRKTGRLQQITKGDFWVRDVIAVEGDGSEDGYILFTANGGGCKNMGLVASSMDGTITEEDPYNIHLYRVGLNGKGLLKLTHEKGNHEIKYNNYSKTVVDTYSSPLCPPVTVLRNTTNGAVISELERADITRLKEAGWQEPEVFVAPGRDGKTDMWGVILRPTNFDPTKKYPVIEYIYASPGGQYVPKSFTTWYSWMTELAELGFIVVQLDAMGTSFRTLDFEQVCYKNLKDAGFPDRKAWIRAAAEKYPYMDLERVGIFGSSAGGQEAMAALLFHNDLYKVAYSACGCHDNRMDKTWWNEQWMGWPVDSAYIESSNAANAHLLKGKLMLMVGAMDDNVDPASTYQVVEALQKANKDFDFILAPSAGHTMGNAFADRKRYDHFVKHLLGVEPLAWE